MAKSYRPLWNWVARLALLYHYGRMFPYGIIVHLRYKYAHLALCALMALCAYLALMPPSGINCHLGNNVPFRHKCVHLTLLAHLALM